MRRNYVVLVVFSVFLGVVVGKSLFDFYNVKDEDDYNSYIVEFGTYDNIDDAKRASGMVDNSIMVFKDSRYYVYLGFTTKYDNAMKMVSAFKEFDIDATVQKNVINNVEFISNLEQYDVLLSEVESSKDVLSIANVILASYEEIVAGN